jgi:tRNA 2-thiouridine synthesizing protein A
MSPEVLDARGLRCPVPVALSRRRLQALPEGALLTILGDDPLFVLDMQAFCAQEGHAYLGHEDDAAGGWRLTVRKVNASST